jgi:hypothetical protein
MMPSLLKGKFVEVRIPKMYLTVIPVPEFVNVKEPRNRFQGIDSPAFVLYTVEPVRQLELSYRPTRLEIDSWAP